MISKTYIMQNLDQLEVAYNKATSQATMQKQLHYFSKLAILELCGWIEMSMDDLIIRHANRKLVETRNSNDVEKFVKKNYGFDYDNNFRQMLMKLVGIVTCEKLEAKISLQVHAKFTAQLQTLKLVRNSLAHTYSKGQAVAIDSPIVTKTRFVDLYEGLKAYETALKKL